MLVIKAHKIQLKVNRRTDAVFVAWCGTARFAYNFGLERKINSYKATGKSPSSYDLMKEIVVLKKTEEYAWLNSVPSSVPRMALLHLDIAYRNFFRRVKGGDAKPGFPKFKSRRRSKLSFGLEPHVVPVNGKHVRIPKVGWIKMYQAIRFEGRLVGEVCISKVAGRWYATFSIETEIPDPIEKQERVVVGLDAGIKTLATLSDGMKFENPKATYHLEGLLAKAQRQMARKQKGSNRWQLAKLRVQRIHKRIADLRSNATHYVSAYVVSNYDGVAIEDLNVRGMAKNRHLAKAVADANMSELHRQLIYKMCWSGGEVRQVGRFFPSSKLCSVCGCINSGLKLSDRIWTCDCGAHHDRDVNAAINLVTGCYGRGLPVTARGGSGAVMPADEARTALCG